MSHKSHNATLAKLERDYHAPSSLTDDSIYNFFSALNCARALSCWILFSNKEYDQLLSLEVNPLDFNDPFTFRDAFAATSFLSKADFIPLSVKKEDAAFAKFFEFEELCRETNNRFRSPLSDPLYKGPNTWLLNAITRKIEKILGDFVPEEFVDESNWGPGVTTLLKGENVSAINKFHSENGITRDLYSLVQPWFPTAYPRWSEHLTLQKGEHWADLQVGNTIVTVPKNSKTDRVIAVEPGINLWFQKGIGSMIRRRLLRVGVDLTDQTKNQRFAQSSSHRGDFATVDFSSASDSISHELILTILPDRWKQLLVASRSPFGTHKGKLVKWEKFSSMGNGFTFELESLLFYAAAISVCDFLGLKPEVSVFGDDVIIPTSAYELFSSFSTFLGFRVNMKKSYSSSYFRESCGSYYFDGVDVKPIFLKRKIRNAQAVYKLANSIRNLAHRRNSHYGCDARFRYVWRNLFDRLPKPLRLKTSRELGDCGFACNLDEAAPPIADSRLFAGYEGYRPLALLELGVNQDFDSPAVLLARLKVPSSQEYGNSYTLRGRTKKRFSRVLVSQWYNYGPWF